MTAHSSILANQIEYLCSTCGEYFPEDKLIDYALFDRQNGTWSDWQFCPECVLLGKPELVRDAG